MSAFAGCDREACYQVMVTVTDDGDDDDDDGDDDGVCMKLSTQELYQQHQHESSVSSNGCHNGEITDHSTAGVKRSAADSNHVVPTTSAGQRTAVIVITSRHHSLTRPEQY